MAPRKPAGKAGRKPQKNQGDTFAPKGRDGRDNRIPKGGRGRGDDSRSSRAYSQKPAQDRGRFNDGRRLAIKTGEDVSILEGRHAFEEAMETGAPIECVYVSNSLSAEDNIIRLANEAKRKGIKVRVVDASSLDAYSSHGAHQGVVAKLKPYRYAALGELIEAAAGKENALIIATDHVTDAGNFGAIVRSAEVVGASGVLIPNKRNARVNTAAYKTSAGAVMHLPIAMEANLARSLEALKKEGFWIVGASEHADDIIWDAPLSGRVCLVMGSESDGLSRLTLEACDLLVKLPQLGRVESLNVAQATTAIAYEWARQSRSVEG